MTTPIDRPSRVRILIADDHPIFRQGLRQAIEVETLFEVIDEQGNGQATLQAIRTLNPDLSILDINMPGLDGLAVVRQMRALRLPTKVIFLTMHKEKDLFDVAMELRVEGFVLKESAVSDIIEAIQTVMAGHRYLSPALGDLVYTHCAEAQALRRQKPGLDDLTPAERRILKLIAADLTSKEIANELGLSPRTVENHRTNICAKLDVHGVHGLVKFAYEHKSRL